MRLVTSPTPAGLLLRRLGVLAIVGPPLLGGIAHLLLVAAGIIDVPLTLAVVTTVGVPVALLLIMLTARRLDHAHRALEASRDRVESLIEQSADGFFVADLAGRYTEVNEAGCRMLGYTRDDIIGKTILDFIPASEVQRLEASPNGI
jgi:PAS domain-containing protein